MKALLVIDVQKGYMEKYEPELLKRINQRIEAAVRNNELIIYVKNIKRLRSGDIIYEFAQGLKVDSPYVFCKETASAFSNREMTEFLIESQITEIELIGIDGNSCVASSALDGQKQGYKVIIPCEYIGVQNKERFEKKKMSLEEHGIKII